MSEAKIVLTAVDQTKAAIESAKRNMASIGETVTRVTGLMGPLGVAIAGAFSVQAFKGVLDMMDQLDEMSEKTGVSVEALSKLRYAGESVGTTTEQLGGGLRKLAKLMGDAASGSEEAGNIFKAMGVSFKDASGNLRDTDQVLSDMAGKFATWKDGPEKAAMAMKIFGKSGEDMIPILNLGSTGLENMGNEAERLGIKLSGDAAKAAADFNDNLKKISLTAEAAGMAIMDPFVSSLGSLSQAFLDAKMNGEGFFGVLSRGMAKLPDLGDIDLGPATRFAKILMQSGKVLEGTVAGSSKAGAGRGTIADPRSMGDPGSILSQVRNWGGKPDIEKLGEKKKTASDTGANTVNNLISEYARLSGSMTKVDEVQRMLQISGDKFTFAQKQQALATAAQIDAFNHKKIANDAEEKGMRELIALQEQAELAYGRTILAMSDEARAMAFNTSLIGKTAEEVARLTFERELAIKVAQAESMVMNDANNGLITQIEATERLAAVQRLASDTRAEFMAQQADQINQQYDAMRGVNDAVKEYQLSISKMGENTKGVMTNAFRGMEDALTNFVRTGKLDFKSLADSIISDMIRMQIQQSVTGPLAGILGKAIGSYFGGGFNGTPINPNSGEFMGSLEFANGGIMTSGGELPLHAYSNGGIADSPQLAIFGEGRMNEAYVPLPDGRTIPVTMSGGGGANVVVNVLPGSGQTADVKTSQDSQGNMTLDVVIRQIEDSMAGNMAAGSGSLFNATASRFVPQGAR
jgi:lambda family phage tail tape measure protein